MKAVKAVVNREILLVWRDRDLRCLLLLGPLLGLLLFAGIYSAQVIKHIPVAVLDLDRSQTSLEMVKDFANSESLNITAYPDSYDELEGMIERGEVVVGVVIPEDLGRDLDRRKGSRILCIVDASNTIYATNASNAVLTVTRTIGARVAVKALISHGADPQLAQEAYQGIEYSDAAWFNPTLNYAYFLVVGLAVHVWQYCFMLLAAMLVVGETGRRSWLQYKAAGFSLPRLFAGKAAVHLAVSMALILIVYWFAFSVLKYPLAGSFEKLLLLTVLFALSVHSIGSFISSLAPNALDATRISMVIAIPSFAVTGYTWPLEAMPEFLGKLAWLLPHTWFFQAFNYLSFKGDNWRFILPYMVVLLLTAVLFYSLTAAVIRVKEG